MNKLLIAILAILIINLAVNVRLEQGTDISERIKVSTEHADQSYNEIMKILHNIEVSLDDIKQRQNSK